MALKRKKKKKKKKRVEVVHGLYSTIWNQWRVVLRRYDLKCDSLHSVGHYVACQNMWDMVLAFKVI